MTQDLFSAQGFAALRRLDADHSLLMFDLDGTLAPIVLQPHDAVVPEPTASRLRDLSARWRVAVITGRTVEDAVHRLGFKPCYIAGNHGAESRHAACNAGLQRKLDDCRNYLLKHIAELEEREIVLEDKGLSLALHYRSAADQSAALTWLNSFVATLGNDVMTTNGKCVFNIVPSGAWDKGDALLEFMNAANASHSLVVGDDVNDEPAFLKANRKSVTVRIGNKSDPTVARFSLDSQTQFNQLLDYLLCTGS